LILLAIHQGLVHTCSRKTFSRNTRPCSRGSKFAFPPDEIAAVLAMFRSEGELSCQTDASGKSRLLPVTI
jgi:hypothetical protein